MTSWLSRLLLIALLALSSAWWVPAAPAAPGATHIVITDEVGDHVQTTSGGALPAFATPDIAALYRFAHDRGDVLRWMPCTCGCAGIGHTSNRSCYIKAEGTGRTTWTSHAAT
ncbi:MAG TPA: PCYCGC motif-containing (lipo)protein [Methylomirabilota bacterium]|nr:PCYCGC motif-containing (lipo)protein [Methylomirabilota bacterium]